MLCSFAFSVLRSFAFSVLLELYLDPVHRLLSAKLIFFHAKAEIFICSPDSWSGNLKQKTKEVMRPFPTHKHLLAISQTSLTSANTSFIKHQALLFKGSYGGI